MFCKNCGASVKPEYLFCAVCGSAIEKEGPATAEPEAQPTVEQQANAQPIYYTVPQSEPGKGFAVTSLVLGIVSFFFMPFAMSALAIIFGAIAVNKGQSGMATAGLICGVVSFVFYAILTTVGVATIMALIQGIL